MKMEPVGLSSQRERREEEASRNSDNNKKGAKNVTDAIKEIKKSNKIAIRGTLF